ncbi:MFS transporter [Pseudonocardia spinosispora]|uniref:MFS transporter n=1 Tax=Pseudonocardia spinosispora TaxID=103441 RepID=UPI000403871B|nr:MFS transporter [Pseudonocardia spinosispora]
MSDGTSSSGEGLIGRLRIAAVYVGAALGPFGGGVVSPMLPQIGQSLGVSVSTAALSLSVYFVPFALVQLVSGTLGERWGRRRTVFIAYLVYLVAAVVCAVAPDAWLFLSMRGVLGAANAFTSPLLLAGLADMVPTARLSRSVGIFTSCQAGGQSFAPLIGGLAAGTNWRWGFLVVAVAAALLALAPPPGSARRGVAAPRLRPLVNPRMGLLSVAAFVSYFGAVSLPFLVALYCTDHLRLDPEVTGFALLGFGVAGLVLGAIWGGLTEKVGARTCGVVASVLTAGCVASVSHTGSLVALALCWTAAGVASSLLNVSLQNLTVRAVPTNRGGALSGVSAFRFTGSAVGPLILLPIYHGQVNLAFAVAGGSLLLAAVALAALPQLTAPPDGEPVATPE